MVPFGASVPQFDEITLFARPALLMPGARPPLEVSDQTTVSPAPVASLFSVPVRVTAGAPEPNVTVLPVLEATETLIALIVNVTAPVFVLSLADMAVIVAVQSALSVAADGGV